MITRTLSTLGCLSAVCVLCACQNYLIFNTDTKFGLDISQRADQVPEVTLGYQRLAIASIPVITNSPSAGSGHSIDANSTNDAYSVIGTFHVFYKPSLIVSNPTNGLQINQVFATGIAAQELAKDPRMAAMFAGEVGRIFSKKFRTETNNQPVTANPPQR